VHKKRRTELLKRRLLGRQSFAAAPRLVGAAVDDGAGSSSGDCGMISGSSFFVAAVVGEGDVEKRACVSRPGFVFVVVGDGDNERVGVRNARNDASSSFVWVDSDAGDDGIAVAVVADVDEKRRDVRKERVQASRFGSSVASNRRIVARAPSIRLILNIEGLAMMILGFRSGELFVFFFKCKS
jgi:hypothetical protein